VISEAEHFLVFRLQLETDIARVKEILPKKYNREKDQVSHPGSDLIKYIFLEVLHSNTV